MKFPKMKGGGFRWLSVGISSVVVFALVLLVYREWELVAALEFDFEVLPIAFLVLFVSLLARAIRWYYLMRWSTGENNLSVWFAFRLLLLGTALNIIMPAGTGDVAKSYFGYKWTGIKEKMLAVSLYDKLIALAALFPLGIYSYFQLQSTVILLVSFLLMLPWLFVECLRIPSLGNAISRLWMRWPWLNRKLDYRLLLSSTRYKSGQKFLAYAISVIGWCLSYGMLWFSFLLLGKRIELDLVLALSPVMTLGRLFPFTLNGIGTDEAVILFLFKPYVGPDILILCAALVYRALLLLLPGIIGLLFLFGGRKNVGRGMD